MEIKELIVGMSSRGSRSPAYRYVRSGSVSRGRCSDERRRRLWGGGGGREGEREILITTAETAVGRRVQPRRGWPMVVCMWGGGEGMVGRCENAITRIVCVSAGRCECVRGARIITKYRELIKHIVGARRLDNRYKLPPRAKQLTGETRAYSTRQQWRRRPIRPPGATVVADGGCCRVRAIPQARWTRVCARWRFIQLSHDLAV